MAYVLSLQPTFTQGFILGQLSVLLLLGLILKYLFFDTSTEPISSSPPTALRHLGNDRLRESIRRLDALDAGDSGERHLLEPEESVDTLPVPDGKETTEWFNLIIHEIFNAYRAGLRDNVRGLAGEEVARARIERWINAHKGSTLIDPVFVDAVSLGNSAPRLFNAQIIPNDQNDPSQTGPRRIQIDASYTDSISLQLTTSLFFNQPVPFFARLPVSLSLTLSILRATITIEPPAKDVPDPVLVIRLEPDLELSLKQESSLGSRAKLANVPKIHELIENRMRRAIVDHGTWKIHLPMRKDPV